MILGIVIFFIVLIIAYVIYTNPEANKKITSLIGEVFGPKIENTPSTNTGTNGNNTNTNGNNTNTNTNTNTGTNGNVPIESPIVDPKNVCTLVPTCEKIDGVDMNNWNVQCQGQMDNTLRKNSPTDWNWMKGYNTATFSRYTNPLDAVKAACPPFDAPVCAIDTCTGITQIGKQDWNVQCKGQMDNTLHMNSPNEWVWMKGYNDATFAKHPTAAAAIRAACPSFNSPTCAGIESCTNVTQTGTKDWTVQCKGQIDNTLHMNSPTEWVWMKAYNDATFAKHASATAAINAACPPFQAATDPGVCSPTLNNCSAVMPVNIPGYGANQTAVKCVGDSNYTNTLMGSPGRWLYYKGYNDATFAKYIDVPSAIRAYCNSTPRRGSYSS